MTDLLMLLECLVALHDVRVLLQLLVELQLLLSRLQSQLVLNGVQLKEGIGYYKLQQSQLRNSR
jgi:hypothetical protein